MFTGIIEALGKVQTSETKGTNQNLLGPITLSPELKIDQRKHSA